MNKVLVTGAAGFIGSHLTRDLLNRGNNQIVALDDLSGGYESNIPESVEFVKGSITDEKLVNSLFEKHTFDYVYHLAAYAAEGLSHFIRHYNYENNLIGSVNLINASIKAKVKCFVFTSSIAVYGANQVPMREDMIPQPEDPYGIAKYAVEMDLKSAHEMFGLNYAIFRPHNVYGEYQNIADRYRNVVGIFMNQILQGKPMTIFGDGNQQRAFSYVGDIIKPIVESAWESKSWGKIFNVGADKPYTVNELAKAVASVMGADNHPIRYLDARNEVYIAYSEHEACRAVFGEGQSTSLESGLRKMADWVGEFGSRETPKFTSIEIEENLPAFWTL